ncbi:MAG: ATP-binding protein, partial [Halobacteriales archaeon]
QCGHNRRCLDHIQDRCQRLCPAPISRVMSVQEDIHVLHIDDDPDFADLTAERLTREAGRLTVETVADAGEGLERLADGFDCVISDYDMPGMDGIELLEAVRADYPDLPFILFTGEGSEDIASEAISAGVTDYIPKRADPDQHTVLANRIENAVEKWRAEHDAEQARTRLTTLIDNLPGIVYRCQNEPGWAMEYVGGDVEELTGYPAAEIENRDDIYGQEIVHPDDRDAGWADVQAALEAEEPFELTYRIRTNDGETKWVWERGQGIYSADGEVEALEGFITDITERKELADELREKSSLLDDIFERLPIHLYVKDEEARKVWVSSNFVDDPEEQIGKTDLELYPEEFSQHSYADDMEVIETGEPIIDKEEHVEYVDDWHLTSKVPWYDDEGNVQGLIGVTWEITERKEYERELERQNARLDEFASLVSHDLRNPLNVAQGRLDLVQEDCDSPHLEPAVNAVDRSLVLLDDLLTLAREGQRVREAEAVDLADTLEECWRTVAMAEAALVVETDRTIRADPGRLKQLMENLFRNAVEHGGENVTVTVGDMEDGFYIADDGPGIPEEDREEVFEAGFSTADEGTGFGLNIVREIVDAHGWEITVTDSEAGGARFDITGIKSAGE